MDGGMFDANVTQDNLRILTKRGVTIAGPAEGRFASGLIGKGRLIEPIELIGHIRLVLGRNGQLADKKIVVTAGGTSGTSRPRASHYQQILGQARICAGTSRG